LHKLDRWGLTTLQPDDRGHPLLGSECGHHSRVVEIAAEGPLAVNGFAGGKCRGDELSMVRDLDGNSHYVDVRLGHQLLVLREHRSDTKRFPCCARRFRTMRAQCPDRVVRQRAQGRDVSSSGPAPDGADPDDSDTEGRLRHC
jgi:hypothetical protein